MRMSSIIANKSGIIAAAVVALAAWGTMLHAAECTTGKGLASNTVNWIVGKGDTLWMMAGRDSYSLNMIAGDEAIKNPDDERNWWLYSLGCHTQGLFDLAIGGGYTVASFDTAPNILWQYTHETGRTKDVSLSWPQADSSYDFTVVDLLYADGVFFGAASNGGLLRWNNENNEKAVFFPGKPGAHVLGELKLTDIPKPDSMTAVTGIETVADDSLLLVTTPSKLWLFSVRDSLWDSVSVGTACSDPDVSLHRFSYVFVNRLDVARPIYALVDVRLASAKTDTSYLCKYNRREHTWDVLLRRTPKSMTFGWGNILYMLFDETLGGAAVQNIALMYHDLPGDTGSIENPVAVEDERYFNHRMTSQYDVDYPKVLTDILFIPKTDSTGYLWIASSEGLFFSDDEVAGSDTGSFLLIRRAPSVGAGLKTTYARPGIITPSNDGCVFVYNIKKASAKVTIRVYDYNMELVKTIIENRPRLSGKNGGPLGRSTVESEDRWDGRNGSGRVCAPGIYYYKITTDSGERSFGKIVVAR